MARFKDFLIEQDRNTHLDHPEDLLFHGIDDIRKSIVMLISIKKTLTGHSTRQLNITTKWDGAPAIIAGYDPENGKFFVATKSLFNKTPKINYTNRDIDANHQGELANKLKQALYYLPNVVSSGIYQGDFLFSAGDKRKIKIEDEEYVSFRPNTITYAFPLSSSIAKDVITAKLGIVFHTKYSGPSILNLKAEFLGSHAITGNRAIWIPDPTFRDNSGTASLTTTETMAIDSIMSFCGRIFHRLDSSVVNQLSRASSVSTLLKTYINARIREGVFVDGSPGYYGSLLDFINQKIADKKAKQQDLDFIAQNRDQIVLLFTLAENLAHVKMVLLNKMGQISNIGTFIKTSDGYRVTAPEGFVVSDTIMGSVLKIVDRLEFSRANFTLEKEW